MLNWLHQDYRKSRQSLYAKTNELAAESYYSSKNLIANQNAPDLSQISMEKDRNSIVGQNHCKLNSEQIEFCAQTTASGIQFELDEDVGESSKKSQQKVSKTVRLNLLQGRLFCNHLKVIA